MCVKGLSDPGCHCGGLANLLSLCAFHVRRSFVSPVSRICGEGYYCVCLCDGGCSCRSLSVLAQFPSAFLNCSEV